MSSRVDRLAKAGPSWYCSARAGRYGRTALLLASIALRPSSAHADWLIAGYIGAAHTPATTLEVVPGSAAAFELPDVEFVGKAFKSPIYYGYRVGWMKADSSLGIEAEFTHAKTIAVDTHSATLSAFEQSHGLNFILGNLALRSRPFCAGRCIGVGRVGAGISLPHVEATYLGTHAESYQYGGPAVQAGVGLEVAVHKGLLVFADGRVTHTRVNDDVPGATVSGSFTSSHLDLGIGWRFR